MFEMCYFSNSTSTAGSGARNKSVRGQAWMSEVCVFEVKGALHGGQRSVAPFSVVPLGFFFFLTTHKTLTNCSLPPRDSLKHVQVQVQAFTIQCFEAAPHLKVNNLTQRLNFSQKVLIKPFKIPLSP